MEDDEANETIFDSHAGPGDADGLRGRHRAGGAGGDARGPRARARGRHRAAGPDDRGRRRVQRAGPLGALGRGAALLRGQRRPAPPGGRAGHGRGCGGKPAVPGPVQAGGRAPAVDQTPDLCAGAGARRGAARLDVLPRLGRGRVRPLPRGCAGRKRAAPGGKRQQPALCERNAAGLRGDARGPSAAAGGSCGGGACKRSRASTCRTSC